MPSTQTPSPRLVSCETCGVAVDLTGHIGRPPRFCSAGCRQAGRIAYYRARREIRRAEMARLRELVAAYEAAVTTA